MNLPTMSAIWERLKSKYGQTRDIISVVLRDITKPPEKNEDQQLALVNLVDRIEKGMADLETIGALHQLTNEVVVSKIETKLSTRIKLKWFDEQDGLEGDDNFTRMWPFLKKERKTALSFIRQKQDELTNSDNSAPEKQPRRGARANTVEAAVKSDGAKPTSSNLDKCFLHPDGNHFTRQCRKFLSMSINERGKAVSDSKACRFCLAVKAHTVGDGNPCPRESQWNPCQENGCGKFHSRLLHGCTVPGVCNVVSKNKQDASQASSLLLFQEVPTPGGAIKTLWDSCADVCLITKQAASQLRLVGSPVKYDLTVVKGTTTTEETMSYHLELVDRKQKCNIITVYEIDQITDTFEHVDVDKVVHEFKSLSVNNIKRLVGQAEFLVGMQYQHLHPVRMVSVQ